MEKFGIKFAQDNVGNPNSKNVEMSADCGYFLGYATMMLQTSLHNPNAAKSRMKHDDFQKMLKGCNNNENLPEEFLNGVYDHVDNHPFTLNEDDDARMRNEAANAKTFKQKKELFAKETESLVKRGTTEMQDGNLSKYVDVEGT